MADGVTADVRLLAGRYQIGELLGRGGMADVHVGMDARLGRRVAIKLLKPSLANDPAFRTRFRQEAQAAARMAHPTIVRVFDAGEETVRDPSGHEIQVPFIVMEYVDGRLLKDIVAEGPLDPAEAGRIVDGILVALEYSHRAGVVHRDIKPGNVMVTSAGQVKVMDFGIARAISDSSATIAQTSAILGTAQYFSPEQARGEAVDARTDLYSTGVVLYELLTGRPPFQGETAVATAYQHVSEAPTAPNAINPRVSPALNAVVLRSLAKDRIERYQTAADFRADLEIALAGKVPDRGPVGNDFNAALFGVNPDSDRRIGGDAAAPRRRHRRPRAAHPDPPAGRLDLGHHRARRRGRRRRRILGLHPAPRQTSSGRTSPSRFPTSSARATRTAATNCSPLGLEPVKVDVPSDDACRGHDPRASIPRPARGSVPASRCRSPSRPARRRSPSPDSRSRPRSRRKAIIDGLGLVYGETTDHVLAERRAGRGHRHPAAAE